MSAEAIIPLCTHIKTNGAQCQSPALKDQTLCFFHRKLVITHRRPLQALPLNSYSQEYSIDQETLRGEEDPFEVARQYPHQDEIEFPPLEDAEAVQLATSMLFQAIATGQIHYKRARLLIHTLKIASSNQRVLTLTRAAEAEAAAKLAAAKPAPSCHPDPEPAEGAEGAQSSACPQPSRRNLDASGIPQPLTPFSPRPTRQPISLPAAGSTVAKSQTAESPVYVYRRGLVVPNPPPNPTFEPRHSDSPSQNLGRCRTYPAP